MNKCADEGIGGVNQRSYPNNCLSARIAEEVIRAQDFGFPSLIEWTRKCVPFNSSKVPISTERNQVWRLLPPYRERVGKEREGHTCRAYTQSWHAYWWQMKLAGTQKANKEWQLVSYDRNYSADFLLWCFSAEGSTAEDSKKKAQPKQDEGSKGKRTHKKEEDTERFSIRRQEGSMFSSFSLKTATRGALPATGQVAVLDVS